MELRGIISLFARHPVAGNLMMLLMLLFGAWGLTQINRQVLPDFELDLVTIAVQWPGASTSDVEANVIAAIEPEVRFLDKVARVESMAYEGRAEVTLHYKEGVNMSKALTDAQAAVARITTFPSDIERPVITQVIQTDKVASLEISGPFPEESLKSIARGIRDDLLDLGMSTVTMKGMRDSEIWVEVPDGVLRQLDLTVNDVALRIAESSLDLPSGSIQSGGVSRQIRSEGLARSASEVSDIEVVSLASGEKLTIQEIGRIYDTFAVESESRVYENMTSIGMEIRRTRGIDSIEAQQMLAEYVSNLRQRLPPTLRMEMYDVFADQATQRVNMLLWNGLGGLLLVVGILYLFMSPRVAFWVGMGIPISIMAALGGMALLGLSLNMISMFAIIMGLGIIVDDAIVVGEHTEMLHRRGMSPEEATLTAARSMAAPVIAASLTTMAAFFPILTITETIGRIIRELPITIILVIIASLMECFLVLPAHLKKALQRMERHGRPEPSRFHLAFNRFRDNQVSRAVGACFDRRYTTILATVCLWFVALAMLITGRVGFEFFASPETDIVFANASFSPGTSRDQTREMVDEFARAIRAVEEELGGGEGTLVNHMVGTIGKSAGRDMEASSIGDHVGAYTVELVASDKRDVRTKAFMEALFEEVELAPGVEKFVVFELSAGGPPGRDLDVRLAGADLATLKRAALELRGGLKDIPGILAIEDNLPYGKQEIVLELTPAGRAFGFTTEGVARQVRDAFEGAIAKRFSKDEEEILVRVKLRSSPNMRATIRDLYLRAPDGSEVPLTEVVNLKTQIGFSQVRREGGVRQVSVTADIDNQIATLNQVVAELQRDIVPRLMRDYGIDIQFKGKAEEQAQAAGDTRTALLIALMLMYIVLAWVFGSYTTPFVVMSIIPFGLIGAILGHWVMGFNLNMLSLQALLGLFGVMINDSIILVSAINRARNTGADLREAVLTGTRERLRPVVLTTLTTIGGLTPLLFERSLQAQLVQPLAVTLIFGLLVSPFLVLFFVPSLLGVGQDIRQRITGNRPPQTAQPA